MRFVVAALLMSLSILARAQAAEPPPIRLLVPFPASGVTDLTARLVAVHLSAAWKEPVTVVNVPGEGGTTGTLELLRAAPDGRTLMMWATGVATQNPALEGALPYRWDEPTLIARVTTSPLVFVVAGTSPWAGLGRVLDDVRRTPGSFRYGTSGMGGAGSIVIARLLDGAGIDWNRLQRLTFQGGAAILEAVVDGRLQFAAQYLAEMKPLLAEGKLKPLAVSTAARAPALPEVPTGAEAGAPAFNLVGWTGIVGPPHLPAAVVERWDNSLRRLTSDPEFRRALAALSATPAYLGPADFKAALRAEYQEALAAAEKLGLRR